ncbi:MAG TPA: hypothetical protein VFI19_04060, partial [Nocardioides sp.]|nr:hypothetical protein [Nocardioides sp.]
MQTTTTSPRTLSSGTAGVLNLGTFQRWAPIAGIVFVALMIVGSRLVGDIPLPDASDREIADYLADGGRQTTNLVGAYLWVLGALAFLWFLVRLVGDLRRAEGGSGALSTLASAAGVTFAAVWMGSAAAYAAVPYSVAWRDAPVTDTDLVRVLPPLGRLALLLGGGFSGIVLIVAAAAVILKTGVFPRWLAWLGIALSIVLLFDVVYVTIWPFWLWVLIASFVMLARRGGRQQPATTQE